MGRVPLEDRTRLFYLKLVGKKLRLYRTRDDKLVAKWPDAIEKDFLAEVYWWYEFFNRGFATYRGKPVNLNRTYKKAEPIL